MRETQNVEDFGPGRCQVGGRHGKFSLKVERKELGIASSVHQGYLATRLGLPPEVKQTIPKYAEVT